MHWGYLFKVEDDNYKSATPTGLGDNKTLAIECPWRRRDVLNHLLEQESLGLPSQGCAGIWGCWRLQRGWVHDKGRSLLDPGQSEPQLYHPKDPAVCRRILKNQ